MISSRSLCFPSWGFGLCAGIGQTLCVFLRQKFGAPCYHDDMAQCRTLPMPVWVVLSSPAVISASGPAYRLILSLAIVFWGGQCRPLPTDDAGLCALARCGASTWRKEKEAVRDALGQIIPQLERRHIRALQRADIFRQVRVEAGRLGGLAKARNARTAASENCGHQEPPTIQAARPRLGLKAPQISQYGRANRHAEKPAVQNQPNAVWMTEPK